MNKFDIVEMGQRLNKCSRELSKSMALMKRDSAKAEEAFNNLEVAAGKIDLATKFLQIELREVI